MRKVIFLIHMSLDGLVAGPNGEMDWIVYDDEVEQYAHSLHSTTDAAIYGRVTYEMMHSYWPTVLSDPTSSEGAMNHARWYENATKIVVSRTSDIGERPKTLLIRDHIAEEITKLKQQAGKDMWLLGSPTLAQTLMQPGLIDEYRINVNPVVLGSGKALFDGLDAPLNLKLVGNTTFKCGVVALRYEPVRA